MKNNDISIIEMFHWICTWLHYYTIISGMCCITIFENIWKFEITALWNLNWYVNIWMGNFHPWSNNIIVLIIH